MNTFDDDRRSTWRRATTGVTAGVAAVGLAGLGLLQAGPAHGHAGPAPSASASSTATEPDPSRITIPRDAYLTVEDIEDDEGEEWEAVGTVDWPAQDCMTTDGWDAEAQGWKHFYNEETGSHVVHRLFREPGGPPEDLVNHVIRQVNDCVPDQKDPEGDPDQELPFWFERLHGNGIGDSMWATVYAAENPDDEFLDTIVHISAMRYDDMVSIVVQTEANSEVAEGFGTGTAVNGAEQACTVLFGESCVEDPSFEDIPPPLVGPGS